MNTNSLDGQHQPSAYNTIKKCLKKTTSRIGSHMQDKQNPIRQHSNNANARASVQFCRDQQRRGDSGVVLCVCACVCVYTHLWKTRAMSHHRNGICLGGMGKCFRVEWSGARTRVLYGRFLTRCLFRIIQMGCGVCDHRSHIVRQQISGGMLMCVCVCIC